jgi:hypothetical protein
MFARFYGPLFGGILAVILGIVIMAWVEVGYGIACIGGGIVLFIFKLRELNNYRHEQNAKQDRVVKMEQDTVPLQGKVIINIKIADKLKNGKFSIFFNNKNVGNIIYGETKQLSTENNVNIIALGKFNGSSPDNRMKQYSFDASQENGSLNLEITHKSLIIEIIKV